MLKEWAYLDTFDMLAPRYDIPQTLRTVRGWFSEAGLTEVEVEFGYNGIQGRGKTPAAGSPPTEPHASRKVDGPEADKLSERS